MRCCVAAAYLVALAFSLGGCSRFGFGQSDQDAATADSNVLRDAVRDLPHRATDGLSDRPGASLDGVTEAALDTGAPSDCTGGLARTVTVNALGAAVFAGTAVSVVFDHAIEVGQGQALADGSDVRVFYEGSGIRVELDRIALSKGWNVAETRVWFALARDITASRSDGAYLLSYGASCSTAVRQDTANIFLFFDDFEGTLDTSKWIVAEGQVAASGGSLRVQPSSAVRSVGRFGPKTVWDAQIRLGGDGTELFYDYFVGTAATNGTGRSWFRQNQPYVSLFSDANQHYAERGTHSVTIFHRTVLSIAPGTGDHEYRMVRDGTAEIRFFYDDTPMTTLDTLVPVGDLHALVVNTAATGNIAYRWFRVRSLVEPEPTVVLGAEMPLP